MIAEVVDGRIVMEPLRPRIVNVDPRLVEEILSEEHRLEENRYGDM